jgi:hypothetical protein
MVSSAGRRLTCDEIPPTHLGNPEVHLDFTDGQQALRQALEAFLVNASPLAVVRASEPLGFDADLWRKVVKLGIVCLGAPRLRRVADPPLGTSDHCGRPDRQPPRRGRRRRPLSSASCRAFLMNRHI